MESLDKLEEMINSFPLTLELVKSGLMHHIKEARKEIQDIKDRSITWSVEDFEYRALDVHGTDWEKYFDKGLFENALYDMIQNHDCNNGITWDIIDCYLDNCKK